MVQILQMVKEKGVKIKMAVVMEQMEQVRERQEKVEMNLREEQKDLQMKIDLMNLRKDRYDLQMKIDLMKMEIASKMMKKARIVKDQVMTVMMKKPHKIDLETGTNKAETV
jgi:hypothetical protein